VSCVVRRPGVVAGIRSMHLRVVHFLCGDWDVALAEAEGAYAACFPSAGPGAIGGLFRQRAAARSLLGEAAELYARVGMPRHRELTERLLATSAG